jgi:hypothetical protein
VCCDLGAVCVNQPGDSVKETGTGPPSAPYGLTRPPPGAPTAITGRGETSSRPPPPGCHPYEPSCTTQLGEGSCATQHSTDNRQHPVWWSSTQDSALAKGALYRLCTQHRLARRLIVIRERVTPASRSHAAPARSHTARPNVHVPSRPRHSIRPDSKLHRPASS